MHGNEEDAYAFLRGDDGNNFFSHDRLIIAKEREGDPYPQHWLEVAMDMCASAESCPQ